MRILATIALALLATTTRADAFCGFYAGGAGTKMFNNATQVVLMRHGQTTVLSMQNNYQGPPARFAMVVPVPVVLREENVKTLPRELFDKVDQLGAPRLVEYWEVDPCSPVANYGVSFSGSSSLENAYVLASSSDDDADQVKVEARFSVGEYDIVVLSAGESTGLERWLRRHEYAIPDAAAPLLRPYIEQGMKFFVAKVDPKKVRFENGMATLSPLRFHYDSPELALPIRLGLASSSGTQDLIVNILAPNTRYEVANYPNVTIPTNLVLKENARERFAEFYVSLFDHAVREVPNAVVTEYAWDSSSCDPCPGPTLDQTDLATLGADVLAQTYKNLSPTGMTLTRLHARYGKDVTNDLVFRAVQPIAGGRGTPDAKGGMDTTVADEGINNFQGRYAILHPWTGPVACETPQRGVWGGPPGGAPQQATAGTKLAFAPRGTLELATVLASAPPTVGPLASPSNRLPLPIRQPQGCGCAAGSGASASAFALLLGFVLRRRRRA